MNARDVKGLDQLVEAFLLLKTPEECKAFLFDLCSHTEILSLAQRLQIAKMLNNKEVYNSITAATGTSTATISRVNRTLNFGDNGFKLILDRMKDKDGTQL